MKAGIIGGAGYTAGELIRLLLNHPSVELAYVQSSSNAGNKLAQVHEGLWGETDMQFVPDFELSDVDVLFLCQGHGFSRQFWTVHKRPSDLLVIDLAQDYRDESEGYVYGLPELNLSRISQSKLIANPGCFATAIQLGLLPLACANKLPQEVYVTAITGSTGAGVKPSATTHFSWRNDNISVYKAFEHQHLKEIRQSLTQLQPAWSGELNFVPMRGDFPRGIFAMSTITTDMPIDEAYALYRDFYKNAAFTHVIDQPVDMKQAVNTNKAVISLEKHGNKLLVLSAIDNLLKGASGQAVQNMNIMLGLDQTAGLKLKPSAF